MIDNTKNENDSPVSPETTRNLAELSGEELIEENRRLLQTLNSQYGNFLDAAHEGGLSDTELEAAIIDGWNSDALPRTVVSQDHRGSGRAIIILHGQVPSDFFDKLDPDFGAEIETEGEFKGITIYELGKDVTQSPNPDDPTAFYAERGMLAQTINPHFDADKQRHLIKSVTESLPTPAE